MACIRRISGSVIQVTVRLDAKRGQASVDEMTLRYLFPSCVILQLSTLVNALLRMSSIPQSDLIAALIAMPERELVEVINHALQNRVAEVVDPEFEEARLLLAEAYRCRPAPGAEASWDLLILAAPMSPGSFVTDGHGPTQEGTCCGVSLAAYAKSIVCPLCGKAAFAT